VPPSDLAGEEAWPTQPFPVQPPPFSGQRLTQEHASRISTATHEAVTTRLAALRTGADYIPPSVEGTVIYPGFDGGAEWGGAAFDPETGLLYVNANEMAWILTMEPTGAPVEDAGESVYLGACVMCHGKDMKGDPTGAYPSLIGVADRMTPDALRAHIEQGKGMMPGMAHLGADQIDAVIRYVSGVATAGADAPARDPHALAYRHTGWIRWLDEGGYPVMQPPWGTLTAIDLNRGEPAWQVPLGEFPELTARGIPRTGTENYGGPVATAGGLVFIGASKDERFRAFDKATGEELWSTTLPAGGYATPSVYAVDGRQYVVIACGGAKMGTSPGESYMAFALPE
jgi:quinoprotein glucose dehydrogenase